MSDQLTSTRLMAMQVVITREEGEFLGLGILAEDNVRGVRLLPSPPCLFFFVFAHFTIEGAERERFTCVTSWCGCQGSRV